MLRLLNHAPMALALACVARWIQFPSAFMADDSFFYLVTARRLVTTGVQTFSGVFTTNGVHPLWFYVLSAWEWLVLQLGSEAALWSERIAIAPSAALYLGGVVALRRFAERVVPDRFVLFTPLVAYVGVMMMLGSEGILLFFAASAMLACLAASDPFATPARAALTGACLSMLFLSRLDSAFWCAAIALQALLSARFDRRYVVLALAVAAVPALAYVASNLCFFHGLTPVSGWLKSSFPVPDPTGFEPRGLLASTFANYNPLFGWAPLFLAVFALFRSEAARGSLPFRTLVIGCVVHAAYTSLFATASYFYWYFVLDMVAGVVALAFLARPGVALWLARGVAVGVLAASVGMLVFKRDPRISPTLLDRAVVRYLKAHRIEQSTLLVTDFPGIIAFYTRNEVVAVDMLTANRRLYADIAREPNPLRALIDQSRLAGHPIDYVIFDGGELAGVDDSFRWLEMIDPKHTPATRPFGRIALPEPLHAEPGFAIWKVPGTVDDAREQPAQGTEPTDPLKACGLPADYVPPWGTDPIPVDEQVPGAIGLGALPVIGCPPAPAKPGEPDVKLADYALTGSPYREPNRRMLLARQAPIRACYAQQLARGGSAVEVTGTLAIAGDGMVSEARIEAPPEAAALDACIETALRGTRLHGAPEGKPSQITLRYRP